MRENNWKPRRGLGAPMARMSAFGFTDEDHYPDLIRRAAARYREVEGWAREAGVRALVELHHGTIWPSASAAIRIIGDRDPAHVGVLLDPGNMVLEGAGELVLRCGASGARSSPMST